MSTREPVTDRASNGTRLSVVFALFCLAVSMSQSDLIMGVLGAGILAIGLISHRSLATEPRLVLALSMALVTYSAFDPRLLTTGRPLGPWPLLFSAGQLAILAFTFVAVIRASFFKTSIYLAVGFLMLSGAIALLVTPEPTIEVALLHEDAARVLRAGGNPYSDVLVMANGTPEVEPFPITGYTYPPSALVAFAGSSLVFGDARWAGYLSIVLAAVLIAHITLRRLTPESVALAVAFFMQPGLLLVLEAAWTETLTVLFFSMFWWLKDRKLVLSSLLLGVALASKQYLVLLLPLFLAQPLQGRRRWILIGILASTLPAAIPDPVRFFDSTVLFHMRIGQLTTTGTIGAIFQALGSDMRVPTTVAVGIPVIFALLISRRCHGWRHLALASAGILAIAFALGPQAYPNYWMLMAFLIMLSTVPGSPPIADRASAPTLVTLVGHIPTRRRAPWTKRADRTVLPFSHLRSAVPR